MICKNCSTHFDGNYCYHCGQKAVIKRLRISDVFRDFIDSFNLDSGLFLTIKLLFTTPQIIIGNYIKGKRKTYYNPIKFYFLFVSIHALVLSVFSSKKTGDIDFMSSPFYFTTIMLTFIPILSFFTFLITRKKYNYTENIVVNLYVSGIFNIIAVFTFFIRMGIYFIGNDYIIFYFTLPIIIIPPAIYLTWVYKRITLKSTFFLFFYNLLAYFLSFFIFILLVYSIEKLGLIDFNLIP